MAEMLVDSTKLDACLDAEADAIRAKTGGSSEIPFDFADRKGFADAIAAIPTGGEPEIVLPSGYTKLDYAESSGTQLINTGVAPAGNLEVCIDFVFLSGPYQSYPPPTGSRNPLFTIMASGSFDGTRYWAIGNKPDFATIKESTMPSGDYAYQEQWSIRASLNAAEAKVVQPPFAVQTAAVPSGMVVTPNENARIGIFGAYDPGGQHRFCPIRFFREWIYDDGVLIRDFVPAMEDSTEEVGLFDLVNNVFYRNMGTGVLTGGTV